MSANLKFLSAVRGMLLACLAASIAIAEADDCDLQVDRTNFTSTIEYDVYAFDRAGATLQLRITNGSDASCRARIALFDNSDQISSLYFADAGLGVETTVARGAGQSSTALHASPVSLELPGNESTEISIDFFTDQHRSVAAGEYFIDLRVGILGADSDEKLLEIPGKLGLSVAPRAQINIAGAAGDFGFETYSDIIYFEEPQPGDRRRFFVQSRSNTLTTMTIRSENGGKMVNSEISGSAVNYDFILDGEEIDLSSPWIVPDLPETDLNGVSEEVIVQISEDNTPFFAGEYQDIVTIEVTTQ